GRLAGPGAAGLPLPPRLRPAFPQPARRGCRNVGTGGPALPRPGLPLPGAAPVARRPLRRGTAAAGAGASTGRGEPQADAGGADALGRAQPGPDARRRALLEVHLARRAAGPPAGGTACLSAAVRRQAAARPPARLPAGLRRTPPALLRPRNGLSRAV